MPTTRSATSGKPPKSYAEKKTPNVKSYERHLAAVKSSEQAKDVAHDKKYSRKHRDQARSHTAHGPGLSAVRMLKRGGTRRSKSRGRKYTMRW
jgi:hypothetical protein